MLLGMFENRGFPFVRSTGKTGFRSTASARLRVARSSVSRLAEQLLSQDRRLENADIQDFPQNYGQLLLRSTLGYYHHSR